MKCISDARKKSPSTGGQKGGKDSLRGNDFEEAAEKYRDHIYAVAFNFFRNSSDADDVVQDVLLKLTDLSVNLKATNTSETGFCG